MLNKILMYVCYYIGHFISIPMMEFECCHFLYRPYNFFMLKSFEYGEKIDKSLWDKSQDE